MSDTLGPIDLKESMNKMILNDKRASNVEKLHIAAMAEIAEHLWWVALWVKISLVMLALSIIVFLLFVTG